MAYIDSNPGPGPFEKIKAKIHDRTYYYQGKGKFKGFLNELEANREKRQGAKIKHGGKLPFKQRLEHKFKINLSSGKNKQETPWQLYRGAVKKYKKDFIKGHWEETSKTLDTGKKEEIYVRNPLFSQERRVARKAFRGQLDYKITRKNPKGEVNVSRLSEKNILQKSYLSGKFRGNNPTRTKHSPIIPYGAIGREKFSFKGLAENIKFNKEIREGATNLTGFKRTGSRWKRKDCFSGDKACGPSKFQQWKMNRQKDKRYE